MSASPHKYNNALEATNKRHLLTGKITLYSTGVTIVFCLIDSFFAQYNSAIFDLIVGSVLFVSYFLARWGYARAAKVIGLSFVNSAFIFYSSVLPKEAGVYLYYFPLMAAAAALFEPTEKRLRYLFIGFPFVSLALLFSTNFQVFGDYRMEDTVNPMLFFALNCMCSGFIVIMCINFILRLNEESEKGLHDLAKQITNKNCDLEKANTELDRFLYSASHDLRAPLSSIKGLINVARYDTSDQKIHGYFDMMTDRVNRLEYFIKDIIDYSKNAKTDVVAETVDFNTMLNEVTEDIRFIEGASAIEFNKDVDIDHPVAIDKMRLNIILNNLLANAVKYHDLRKENKWIKVRVSNSNGSVKVAVSDNGSGIAQEHQLKIFDMFYRGTLQSTGSGLGLYIVKEAVEKMRGTISVESQPGVGSSFLVTIPVSRFDIG
jgi:signal transduction histidine kinase